MKEWPAGNKTVNFEEIIKSLREALEFGYYLRRKKVGRDIPWTGLNIGKEERATCPSPDESLMAEQLARFEEDQGRDLLDEILAIAVRLGIEQGRRKARREIEKLGGLIELNSASEALKKEIMND